MITSGTEWKNKKEKKEKRKKRNNKTKREKQHTVPGYTNKKAMGRKINVIIKENSRTNDKQAKNTKTQRNTRSKNGKRKNNLTGYANKKTSD